MWWLACGAMAAVGSYVLTAGRDDGAGGAREVVARLKGIPALRRAREREAGARVVAACERQMPEMLDILALGLSAGLSFDASLELYCSGSDDELAQRLLATMRGWQMGLEGRREALEGLAARVSAPSLVRFCASVSEALSFGAPLAQTLERQADAIREEQRASVEQRIEEVPVRMLVPLGTLVVPAMLLAILGPLLCAALGG